jgi:hypothetical protein
MFIYTPETTKDRSFWDSLKSSLSGLIYAPWVYKYAEEKAEEIIRNRFYFS